MYHRSEMETVDTKPEIKNHYRGHKLSMWLSLIPQIHSPGDSPDLSMRHHHFIEENPQFYDGKRIFAVDASFGKAQIFIFFIFCLSKFSPTGKIRLQSLVRPNVIKMSAPLTTATPKHKTEKTPSPLLPSMTTGEDIWMSCSPTHIFRFRFLLLVFIRWRCVHLRNHFHI